MHVLYTPTDIQSYQAAIDLSLLARPDILVEQLSGRLFDLSIQSYQAVTTCPRPDVLGDKLPGRQLDLTGLDQRLQSRQVGVNGNVTEADEANTSRGHG